MTKHKGLTKVTIYDDWCKGCGLCKAFCPANVFEMGPNGKAVVVREDECIYCGFCELHCPDFAVMVRPKRTIRHKSPKTAEDEIVLVEEVDDPSVQPHPEESPEQHGEADQENESPEKDGQSEKTDKDKE